MNDDEASAIETTIAGRVGGDAKAGDTVTLTVNGNNFNGQVAAGAGGALVYSIDVSTADLLASPVIEASVTATDAAGNRKTATASKTISVDREAQASITIDTVAGDDVLNDDESSEPVTTITGTVGGDAKVGDTVMLTVNGKAFTGEVVAGSDGALVYSVDVATSDLLASPAVEASVTATDAAGNRVTATANKALAVDRVAEASITIDAVAGDDILNDDESSALATTVTGRVGGDVKAGDTVTLMVNGKAFTGEVTVGAGGVLVYSIDVATSDLLALPAIEASVTATDAAGNRAMAVASKTLAVDRVAEAVIGIDVVAEDDVLNDAESSALTTTVNGTVGGDVKAGDTVTLTVNGKTFTGEVMAGAADALIYSIDVATSDLLASPFIEASVTATDAAGNRATATADRTLAVDREAQASITIDTIAGDDILNEEEASAPTIVITGAVGGDVKVGDTVTLTVNGNTYTGQVTVGAGGALVYSIGVATSDVVASPAIEASVTALDAAGNSRTATAVRSITVDVSAPEADGSTIAVAEDQAVDIGWQDLSVRGDDVDYIVITQIPAKGLLEYKDQDGAWKAVAAGQTFMPEQIESGLRFTPAENESGPNYAGLGFHAVDKVGNVGETATISIDVTPVADAPDVSLSISEGKAVPGGGSAVDATIIQVNGGSGRPGGFDVQDGKIIRIGDGVRIWLTEGDVVPEIVSSGSSAPAGQIKYYDAHGNPQGDGQYADIFVIHENSSGFYRQSDWPADRKDPRDIQAVHGTSTGNGPNAFKDYIFVQGSPAKDGGPGFDATYQTNNNNATHVNTLNGVYVTYKDAQGNVKTLVRSGNQLEGIIFGDGQHTVLADPGDTTLAREESTPGHIEYELQASAVLRDLDGSESLSGITLTGLPEGTILSYGDTTVTIGADGRHLIANPHDYVAHPVAGAGSAGSSFVIGFTIKVPVGSEPFTIRAEATATEMGNQQASQGHAEAAVDMSVDAPATDDPTPDTPEPDTPTPPDDPSAPEPTGAELLLNGDFKIYANAGDWGPGNPGNIYGGFKHWTASADFMSNAYRMENKPYVGVWKGSGQDISLKQHISGVTAGTVLEFDLAWNNPNHGAPAGGYNAGNPENTGRSVSLEITFGGVVYAMVTTPWASASVADSQFATVTAFNGAQVNIGQIATWYNTYGWRGEDVHPLPPTVEGIFDKLQITLPDDVALTGDLQLRWVPGSETIAKGQDYMDDLMIANVKVLQGVPPEAPPQAFSLLDDVAVEDDDAPDYVYDAPALARLNSILDDDAPTYDEDDASTASRQSDAVPIESAVAGYGPASEKQSPLELEQLFTDAEHVEGSLEHHLIPDAGEPGSETVLAANRDGTADAAGNGPRPVILHVGANVDFTAADTQSELIQSMIADGKQKVDQA
ncbi:MAG: Ig-like domain-containing protein [Candidimonas sp.]